VLELETLGGGLVLEETPPVKRSTLVTTELAAFWTPCTTVLAKLAPGSVGSVTGMEAPPPAEGVLTGEGAPVPVNQGL